MIPNRCICKEGMLNMIYADNAATTQLDIEAFEAMKPYLLNEYGNASQPYSFSRNIKKALRKARIIIAECIGAQPEEIYFTSGGTESDNWAIKCILEYENNNEIITSQIEHHAILNSCAAIEKFGFHVKYLPVDNLGIIHPEVLKRNITPNTKLISVMMANNEIGTIEPIEELAKIAHGVGAVFHTDAVQAVGHIPINVEELGVDILSASGHKFNAPKGVGFLYIRNNIKISSFLDGGAQENKKRAGTENVAGIVAMAIALQNNCKNMQTSINKMLQMEDIILTILNNEKIDYIRNGSSNRLPGNLNLSIKDTEGEMILHRLDLKGISISTGSACDSVNTKVSHVIESIGVPPDYANGTIRISLGKSNTIDEAVIIAKTLVNILKNK